MEPQQPAQAAVVVVLKPQQAVVADLVVAALELTAAQVAAAL
jgi:hypothetical protein